MNSWVPHNMEETSWTPNKLWAVRTGPWTTRIYLLVNWVCPLALWPQMV